MEPSPEILEKFRKKAEAASAIVSEVDSMAQAVAYTVDLCAQKETCQLLLRTVTPSRFSRIWKYSNAIPTIPTICAIYDPYDWIIPSTYVSN